MDFADGADGTGPDHFAKLADVVARMPLIAHLGDHFVFARGQREGAGLADGVGQRLLAINVFPHLNGMGSNEGMHVVRGGDRDCVDIFFLLFEHLAPILVVFGVRSISHCVLRLIFINVANGNDFFFTAVLNIASAFATRANGGNPKFFVRAKFAGQRF